METTADGLEEILTGMAIRPPRPEDAGLEDCALPHESIMEAFSLALKSRITTSAEDDESTGGCIQDPAPNNGAIPDALTGGEVPAKTFCAAEGEKVETGARDEVVVVGDGDGGGDRVIVLGEKEMEAGEKKSCVFDGGSQGGSGGDRKKGICEEEDELTEGEEPRLIEEMI